MLKHLCIILAFISLTITPHYSYCVTSTRGEYVAHSHEDTKSAVIKSRIHSDIHVINIIIDKLENGYIFSKDGQAFIITDSTQIINNHNPESKVQIGELFFKNDKLITIRIK
jgi:hypothetical protein